MTAYFAPLSQIIGPLRVSAPRSQTKAPTQIAGFTIEIHDGPAPLAGEWRELEQSAVTTWFQSYAWVQTWCRTAAPMHTEMPVIVAGRDTAGRLAFILPLAITRIMGMRWLGWLGQSHAGYGFGVYRSDALASLNETTLRRVMREIADQRPGLAGCLLKKQPLTWNGQANPFAGLPQTPSPFAATAFDLKPDFETLMASTYSAKKRSELRRSLTQLRKQVSVSVEIAATPEQRLTAFAAFQDQKSAQLLAEGHVNPFATGPIAAFYHDYLAGDAGSAAAIGTMTVNSEIAAVDMAVIFQDRIYGLNRSMKAGDIRKSSPGRHVNHALIELAFARGCTAYDLGPGEASYKDDWNGHAIPMFTTALSLGTSGIIPARGIAAAFRGIAALKRQAKLWDHLDGLRAKVRLRRVKRLKPAA